MNRVTIVGMGMGNPDTLTVGAWNALREARQIIGAGRLLDALPEGCTAQRTAAVRPGDIAAALRFYACHGFLLGLRTGAGLGRLL